MRSFSRKKAQLIASAAFEDRPLHLHSGIARMVILPSPPLSWIRKQRKSGPNWSDQLRPNDIATLPLPKFMAADHKPLEMLRRQTGTESVAGRLIANVPAGPHNVKLQIEGTLPGGARFKRVALLTVGVQPRRE